MPWIPWIDTVDEDAAEGEAKELYDRTRNRMTGKVSDITRLMSLTPEAAELLVRLRDSIYKNASGLSAREKEVTALVSSSLNGCVH